MSAIAVLYETEQYPFYCLAEASEVPVGAKVFKTLESSYDIKTESKIFITITMDIMDFCMSNPSASEEDLYMAKRRLLVQHDRNFTDF